MSATIELRPTGVGPQRPDPAIEAVKLPKTISVSLCEIGSFLLGTLADAHLRVNRPIPVAVEREDGQWVLQVNEISEVGYGGTFQEALRDLQEALSELFTTLRADSPNLGADLASVLLWLENHVEEHSPSESP